MNKINLEQIIKNLRIIVKQKLFFAEKMIEQNRKQNRNLKVSYYSGMYHAYMEIKHYLNKLK